jgi:hypothetical protein
MPSTDQFRAELIAQIDRAAKQGRPHVEINAGKLHRKLGGSAQSRRTSRHADLLAGRRSAHTRLVQSWRKSPSSFCGLNTAIMPTHRKHE